MTELEKILQQKAIKPTAMRLLVVEKLLKQQYAVSHKELAEQFEKADNITLFRTYRDWETDRKSTRLNSSHSGESRMPSSA